VANGRLDRPRGAGKGACEFGDQLLAGRIGAGIDTVVIDLFNRQVVGFAMGQRMTRPLVMDALRMAWFRGHPGSGLIFRLDRGSQYASNDYRKLLADFKMESSMNRKGDCWDNAVAETLFGSLKVEQLHGMRFATRRQAKDEVMDWITFYNH